MIIRMYNAQMNKYQGGKSRIAKEIGAIINGYIEPKNCEYYEPFVGGGWVYNQVRARYKLASDLDSDLILLYTEISNGWEPPQSITEDQYYSLKKEGPSAVRSWAAYNCSWGAKKWGGYARHKDDDYAAIAYRRFFKYQEFYVGQKFVNCDCLSLNPIHAVIYCDPPYAGTLSFKVGKFDSDQFWEWARDRSKQNIVLISELRAPPDFKPIWQKDYKNQYNRKPRVEKLFIHESHL